MSKEPAHPSKLPFHYGWVIVAAGMMCIFASLGFGRFALGMILPSMGRDLGLTYSEMGLISTGNFLGYLVSVLLSGYAAARVGTRVLIFASLILVGISMALIGVAGGFLTVLILYVLTGFGSGASNVPMMGLVSSWFAPGVRGRAAGFIVIGSGFAIIVSGHLIPFVNETVGEAGWRVNWLILGVAVVGIAVLCFILLRDRPDEKGLVPVGADRDDDPLAGKRAFIPEGPLLRQSVLLHLGAIYFLFGFTYVIYATFIVTSLVNERGFTEAAAGGLWAWIGFLSLLSGPVFGTLSDRLGRRAGFIIVFTLQGLSYLLVASKFPGAPLYLSVILYGVVAWSIPSIMAAAAGDYFGARRAAEAFGLVTFIFGLGQISGPAVAGFLAESSGSFSGSFYMAAALAALAVALTVFLKRPRQAG